VASLYRFQRLAIDHAGPAGAQIDASAPASRPTEGLQFAEGGGVVADMEAGHAEIPRPKPGRGTIGAIR
jgi:hypothetical protein